MNCTRCPRDRTRIIDSSRPVQNIVVVVVNVVVPVVTEVEVEIVVAVRAAAVTV